jgi:nucleoside-diphosphate-sugar epimerase
MNLVTGATGLLGSHIVEQLRQRGEDVRVLVRANSDRSWLDTQGVEYVEGDLNDKAAITTAMQGVRIVYHVAARVGDWGPWPDFQRITIDGTRNMLDAAATAGVDRFLHISSISVFGYYTQPATIDETWATGYKLYKWAYYSRSKWIAENMALDYHRDGKVPVTVVRPAWIYGPRDRATIARMYNMVKAGKAKILGKGDNRLNMVYAGNVAEASILAANHPDAAGEVFNCSNDGPITQQEFFDRFADAAGAPRVKRHVPYAVAYRAGHFLEILGHLFKWKNPPFITRYAVWLMGRRSYFSAEKARRMLGWQPRVTYDEGIPQTVRWYQEQIGARTPTDADQPEPVKAAG